MMGNKQYCYPLTITDYRSRFLLACEGLESTKSLFAFTVFERVFKEYGLPDSIRTDNGTPFASPNALFGLSRLSVWWLRLGIDIERIKPGHPEQNARHDRTIMVNQCGRICIGHCKVNLSTVLAGQKVGIREVADNIWLVSFMHYDLGFFDEEVGRVERGPNPFLPEL